MLLPHLAPGVEPGVLLSLPETGRRLSVSLSTVNRLVKAGKIATVRIGSRRLCPDDEVRRLVSAGRAAA